MKGDTFDFDVANQHAAGEIFPVWNRFALGIVVVPVDDKTVGRGFKAINFSGLFQDPDKLTFAIVSAKANYSFDGRWDKQQLAGI